MKPDDTAIEAIRLMGDAGFRRMPMVQDERVPGVVWSDDFNLAEEGRLEREFK